MWLVAGLGNPGPKYKNTWHNCGFLTMDVLAERNNIDISRSKFKGSYGKGKIAGQDVILLKPETFMNNSGESVVEAANFFKIPPENIIVIFDDIDIAMGKIRVRPSGSAGTHNGMRSIVGLLGSTNFPRVRIGYGPVPENWDLISYVLADIFDDKKDMMKNSFELGAKAVEDWINEHS